MIERIKFFFSRLREQLWIKPLLMCLISVAAVFVARVADFLQVGEFAPSVSQDTTETLLEILASSMLVIATFAVGSMVASYASASRTATPRSFPLVISDDVSQNAFSGFIGAFIFSIVALVALKSGYYEKAGHFVLFCATLLVFAVVILIFLRWVDCIARLGRLGNTIDKVEKATATALEKRKRAMTLGGVAVQPISGERLKVYADCVGYVQLVDVEKLQSQAEKFEISVEVAALPGTFTGPDQPVALLSFSDPDTVDELKKKVASAFVIGGERTFEDDPRFGLVVLSEIAGRALSPAVNDPGTAIDITGTFVRLFVLWAKEVPEDEKRECKYDRVHVPEITMSDMLDDAFIAIARDGAGTVEVGIRLQKALSGLADLGNPELKVAAEHHAKLALSRAERALGLPEDIAAIKAVYNR